MKVFTSFTKILVFILLNIFCVSNALAQDVTDIEEDYFEYTNPAREIAYLHLNKSTYFQKELIGYTAYVIDKKNKLPSLLTTNLYISVLDENQNVILNQLVNVFDGVASNVIEIDSKFNSGIYTIRAYTNWMFNFQELNYFEEKFKVIDPAQESDNIFDYTSNDVKVDFIPESGQILDGVLNNIGIAVKDENKYGIPFAKGTLLDESNNVLTQFETNQYGIGKFPMLADKSKQYTVQITHSNNTYTFKLDKVIKTSGVIIQTIRQEKTLAISVVTNPQTLNQLNGKRYHIFLHNGDIFQSIPVDFNDLTEVNFLVNYKDCAPGTNIITLFDEKQNVVAERLFFNYHDIKISKSQSVTASKKGDSTVVNLKYNGISKNQIQNLSVSVLPMESKSYSRHHNLFTYVYLQPYLKTYVENATHYFVDIDNQKKFELDNLLLTQDHSSYNWREIFNDENDYKYTFEQGIRLRANLNTGAVSSRESYAISTSQDEEPLFFDVESGEDNFYVDNFFPKGDNTIIASKVGKQGLEPAKLYFQSFPVRIPNLIKPTVAIPAKYNNKTAPRPSNDYTEFEYDKENTVILNEVVINSPRELNRQKKLELTNGSYGYVSIISETDRLMFNTLAQYLISKNLNVDQSGGSFRVFNAPPSMNSSGGDPQGQSRPNTGGDGDASQNNNLSSITYSGGTNGPMTIFLNDVQLYDATFLNTLTLFDIDYIDIDRRGFNMGLRGGNGVVRIYTKQGLTRVKRDVNRSQEYKIPLVFNKQENYKIPRFTNINSTFYKTFGTVAWQPNLSTDNAGNLSFNIANFNKPVTVIIEGITEDGQYIIEHKQLQFNN